MILVVDNYDSFVETLARYVREAGEPTRVVRNDGFDADEIAELGPRGVILSPGPYGPAEAGICTALPERLPALPILGICLGHLAIAEAYGGRTIRAGEPVHGRATAIVREGEHPIFEGMPQRFEAGRYHSLVSDIQGTFLRALAHSDDGELMAFAHPDRPHVGLQFHPESVLTPHGRTMIGNFLELCR